MSQQTPALTSSDPWVAGNGAPEDLLATHFQSRLLSGLTVSGIDTIDAATVRGRRRILPVGCPAALGTTLALRVDGRSLAVSVHTRGASPCVECLDRRMRTLLSAAEQIAFAYQGEIPHSAGTPYLFPETLDRIWALIQALIWKRTRGFLSRSEPESSAALQGIIFNCDLLCQSVEYCSFLPDSLCPICAHRESDTPEGAVVELAEGLVPRNGYGRLQSVREFPITVNKFVNPACGALSKRANRKTEHCLTAPVVGAFFDTDHRHQLIVWSGHRTCFRDSLLVGIMEGLERQAGLRCRGKTSDIIASYRELGSVALNPEACGVGHPNCYPATTKLVPYTQDVRCKWVWGYSLTERRSILVPHQMVYYGPPEEGEVRFLEHCSSGCAIGSCLEEAILNGLFELIERDAFMISWNAKLRLLRIAPRSCTDIGILHMVNKMDFLGWDLDLLDARLDLKVPTVIAVARRRDRELGSLLLAAGCGLDPEQAVRAAVSEVAAYLVGFQDTVVKHEEEARRLFADFTQVKDIEDHILLYGLPEMADRLAEFYLGGSLRTYQETYRDYILPDKNETISGHIRSLLADLESRGMSQVILVDQTSREQRVIGATTVCMIVPGLLPIEFGYGRRRGAALSRLWSAPLHAGFAPDASDGLNPLPHPFP